MTQFTKIGLVASFCLFSLFYVTTSEPLEQCIKRSNNKTYNIGDDQQCDKYWQCNSGGKDNNGKDKETRSFERLCPDGFVYSLEISACEYPHNVNCSLRPDLQPPTTPAHPNCPRANGFYPFDPEISCQKFYHCLEGSPYEKTCPEGVIFDPSKGACIHPDLARRPECSAKEVLNFTCPNSLKKFGKLKFGDHDRHSDPEDCRKFIICLRDGRPRLGGCPNGRVFNEKSGFCDSPKEVKGCENYYGKKDPDLLYEASADFEANNKYSTAVKNVIGPATTQATKTKEDEEEDAAEEQQVVINSKKPKKTFKTSKRQVDVDSDSDDDDLSVF
jgi:hypothetical protein